MILRALCNFNFLFYLSIREGMAQEVSVRNDTALDTIITNEVIIDAVCGVIKADIGIKDGMILGVGKGGNPHTMQITPGMIVGVGTDIINGEGYLITVKNFIFLY